MIKELYKFTEVKRAMSTETVMDTTTYTSENKREIYDSLVYEPVAMSSSDKESKSEVSKSSLKVCFSLDNEFAQYWFGNEDSILKLDLLEQDDDGTATAWKGRLVNVEISGKNKILNFESIFSSLRNYGLNKVYQRSCPRFLFDEGCTLEKVNFVTLGTISVVSGTTLTITAAATFDDDYFTYGQVSDGSGNWRMITSHTGDQIEISRPCPTLIVAKQVNIFPGCSKSREVCYTKFNNVKNFGGVPYMPVTDVFDRILVV